MEEEVEDCIKLIMEDDGVCNNKNHDTDDNDAAIGNCFIGHKVVRSISFCIILLVSRCFLFYFIELVFGCSYAGATSLVEELFQSTTYFLQA